ncbi:MAG: hypothetical protein M1816_003907 [Peltula sp. TS41687]|nr:MAG: hypothetical protein M1816_003907 [Peltula sp. TS41687]
MEEVENLQLETSVREHICQQMTGLSPESQLFELLKLLRNVEIIDERLAERISETWDYLVQNRIWAAGNHYESLDALQQDIDFAKTVKPTIERHRRIAGRKKLETQGILNNWHHLPHQVLPRDLIPPWFSDTLLKRLHRLSKICPLENAKFLLAEMVACRHRDQSSNIAGKPHLIPSDVGRVLDQLGCRSHRRSTNEARAPVRAEAVRAEEANPESGSARLMNVMNVTSEERTGPGTGSGLVHTLAAQCPKRTRATVMHRTKPQTPPSGKKRRKRTSGGQAHDEDNEAEDEENEVERREDKEIMCACDKHLRAKIKASAGNPGDMLCILTPLVTRLRESICHRHLRLLLNSFGMNNNAKGEILAQRLRELVFRGWANVSCLQHHRPQWFRKTALNKAGTGIAGEKGTDPPLPTMFRYPIQRSIYLGTISLFEFDAPRVFERHARSGSWVEWEKQGNAVIADFFGRLLSDELMRERIHHEFEMYRHHWKAPDSRPRQGWARNQLPNKQWRLISYPYVAKYTEVAERTGFMHLDLNVHRFVRDGGVGCIPLTGSVSLDDEDNDNCTMLVTGFHHHIRDWYRACLDRGTELGNDHTTSCRSDLYTAQDARRWGRPTPHPCPAGGIRVTRAELIHGSSPRSDRVRRTILPWFSGIQPDHTTLDVVGACSWETVAACHRDRTVPPKDPSGIGAKYKPDGLSFPAAALLPSTSSSQYRVRRSRAIVR